MEKKITEQDLKKQFKLYELDINARKSYSQIGKKVGLSKDTVNNKIKKLEEKLPNKIIQIQENLDSSLLEGKVKNTYMCYESEDKLLCSPSRKYNITPKFP